MVIDDDDPLVCPFRPTAGGPLVGSPYPLSELGAFGGDLRNLRSDWNYPCRSVKSVTQWGQCRLGCGLYQI